ncbi:MAG: hypothetical protein ACRDMV_04375 [Streptosporangiales bacterium]
MSTETILDGRMSKELTSEAEVGVAGAIRPGGHDFAAPAVGERGSERGGNT